MKINSVPTPLFQNHYVREYNKPHVHGYAMVGSVVNKRKRLIDDGGGDADISGNNSSSKRTTSHSQLLANSYNADANADTDATATATAIVNTEEENRDIGADANTNSNSFFTSCINSFFARLGQDDEVCAIVIVLHI